MSRTRTSLAPVAAFVALGILTLTAIAPAFAADAQRQIDRTLAARPNLTVELHNLAGNVTLAAASGSEVRVSGTVHAAATSSSEAERVAGLLTVTAEQVGDRWVVKAVYPLDESRKYCYPRRAEAEALPWFLEWLDLGSSNFKYEGREVRVVSQPSDGALTLYADFRIELPAGVAVTVKEGIGVLSSAGVRGAQNLDLSTGEITVRDGEGALAADTGSGNVEVYNLKGNLKIDTGSGDVRLEQIVAERVDIDTGSGDVHLQDVSGSLLVDTGSGDIIGRSLRLGATFAADTGSGDVSVSGDFAAVTRIDIDTGSGDVILEASPASAVPQVRMAIGTGSGEISLDLPTGRVTRSGHSDVVAEIGNATGVAAISTGSGDVTLRAAH